MPDVAFEYKKLFEGAKLEAVFDATLEWLAKKGAKIRTADGPTLIECTVGRRIDRRVPTAGARAAAAAEPRTAGSNPCRPRTGSESTVSWMDGGDRGTEAL